MAKDDRIAFRTSVRLRERFARCANRVHLKESQLAEACIEALVDFIETRGEVTSPLAMMPLSTLRQIVGAGKDDDAPAIYEKLDGILHASFTAATGSPIADAVGRSSDSTAPLGPHRLNQTPDDPPAPPSTRTRYAETAKPKKRTP